MDLASFQVRDAEARACRVAWRRFMGGVLLGLWLLVEFVPVAPARAVTPGWRVFTVAGDGRDGSPVEGHPATVTSLDPVGLAALPDGGFLVTARDKPHVYRVLPSGRITIVAGRGTRPVSGDGGPAAAAGMNPGDLAVLAVGGFLLTDGGRWSFDRNVIRRVAPDGVVTTVAGTGRDGYTGDGGPATQAAFDGIAAVEALPDGGFLVLDAGNRRVRRVWADGTVSTVAGSGRRGFAGDGGPAVRAAFKDVSDLASLPDGGFLVADFGNRRVRRVDPNGVISTVAGGAPWTEEVRDGAPATSVFLDAHSLTAEPDGSFYAAGLGGIYRVNTRGRIGSVTGGDIWMAGPGTGMFSGDGRGTKWAGVSPGALSRTRDGGILFADAKRVRMLGPRSVTPAAAITGTRIGSRVSVRFATTISGTAKLTATRGGRVLATGQAPTGGGNGNARLTTRIGPGLLRLRLVIEGADGRIAGSEIGVLVGPLTMARARRALDRYNNAIDFFSPGQRRCRRLGPRRIDCEQVAYYDTTGEAFCYEIRAIRLLDRSGIPRVRHYRCPRRGQPLFRRHPRWSDALWPGPWTPVPLLSPLE